MLTCKTMKNDGGKRRRRKCARVVVALAACAAAYGIVRADPQGRGNSRSRGATAGHGQGGATLNPFGVHFRDVTNAAGIHFHHERAASDEKLYLETMGAGVAWID